MKYLLISISFFLISCSSLLQEISISKIKPYNFKLEEEWHMAPPFLLEFSKANKKLWYIGAVHSNELNSETFKLIDSFFSKHTPDIVIIEGLETKESKKIHNLIKAKCSNLKSITNQSFCEENLYTALKAQEFNIPVIGGEPIDEELLRIVKQYGYDEEDYINFWFSSAIPQLYREGKLTLFNQIESNYTEFAKSFPSRNLKYASYKAWLEDKILKVEFQELINANFTAPIKDGNYLQQLSSIIGIERDKHIVKIIFNSLSRYNKVLIVYGHSHVLTQLPAFEAYIDNYIALDLKY
ncbi:MAG: hypothetical protein ACK4OM_00600 [Alphaproteobacteria bacterium]